ncbi:MAG: hypothetical protein ACOCTR_01320 [Candidatus Natronoplasma sp.]
MVIEMLVIVVVILAVYSVILSYLYFKKRAEEKKSLAPPEGKVESKIRETRERLRRIRSKRYSNIKIDIDERR